MNAFNQFVDNIKARAGDGTPTERFNLHRGYILDTNIKRNVSINAQLSSNINFSGNKQSSFLSNFKKPQFTNQLPQSGKYKLVPVAFFIENWNRKIDTGNQIQEALDGSNHVYKHKPSMIDYGNIKLWVSPETLDSKPKNTKDLTTEVEYLVKLLSEPVVRMSHPRFGGTISGAATTIETNEISLRGVEISFDFRQVYDTAQIVVQDLPKDQRRRNFFEKIGNGFKKIKDYSLATIAEINSVVAKLDKISGVFFNVGQSMNALVSGVNGLPRPLNTLAESINFLKSSTQDRVKLPNKLADAFTSVGRNFRNAWDSLPNTKQGSQTATVRNEARRQVVNNLLLTEPNFARDNSELFTATNPESKASFETIVVNAQAMTIGEALFVIDGMSFDKTEEVNDIIATVSKFASPLMAYELYLGTDIYGNHVTHKIEYLTDEMIDVVNDIVVFYNEFLNKMYQLLLTLKEPRSTYISRPMTMVELVRALYDGEYDRSNVEDEGIRITNIAKLNNLSNFWLIQGKIYY